MYPHVFFQLTNKMSSEPEDLDPSSPWKKRDVYLVIIACVIFIFLCYYSLFKLLLCVFNRASSSRNQDQGRLQSHGLEFSAIHALPIFQFKKNDGEQKPINEDCAICLGEFEEGEWVKHLPSCTHCFHVSCIDLWLQSHSNCPLCRSHVPHDIAVDLEGSSVSSSDTLRRENFSQERDTHQQYVRSEILQNLAIGQRSRAG